MYKTQESRQACLSGADDEEDGLGCDAAESLEGWGSCRQTYHFLPKGQSGMMMRVPESFQLQRLEVYVDLRPSHIYW
jgi:hypothetical protein